MTNPIEQDVKQLAQDAENDVTTAAKSAETSVSTEAKSLETSVAKNATEAKSEFESVISKAFTKAKDIWSTEKDLVTHTIISLHRSEQNLVAQLEDAKNAKKVYFALGLASGIVVGVTAILAYSRL